MYVEVVCDQGMKVTAKQGHLSQDRVVGRVDTPCIRVAYSEAGEGGAKTALRCVDLQGLKVLQVRGESRYYRK